MSDQRTSCFLIADEVGLGKTKSAKAVIFELIRMRNTVRCVYLASNVDLANQNMEEFIDQNVKNSYEGVAGFQKENAEVILRNMFDKNYHTAKNINGATLKRLELPENMKKENFRLSTFLPNMINERDSYLMQLSPITSFASGFSEYKGSLGEREQLKNDFDKMFTFLRNTNVITETMTIEAFKKSIDTIAAGDNRLYAEMLCAFLYEIEIRKKREDCAAAIKEISEQTKLTQAILVYYNAIMGKMDLAWKECEITLKLEEDLNAWFHRFRRIRSHASAAIYKMDLIILDEFQRYREILVRDFRDDGYSVYGMLSYLRWRYASESVSYQPKVLLLSATPFKMDKKKVRVNWSYAKAGSYDVGEDKRKDRENPYEDMKELKKIMEQLGACGEKEFFMRRTERPEYRHSILLSRDREYSVNHQRYLDALISFCVKQGIVGEGDFETICKQAYENPGFWRFNAGYSRYAHIEEETKKILLRNQTELEEKIYDNLSLRNLIESALPLEDGKRELPRLWVPPVCTEQTGQGKMLVFTTMKVTTRSAAYYCDRFACEQVESYTGFDTATAEELKETANKLLQKTREELKNVELKRLEEALKQLEKALGSGENKEKKYVYELGNLMNRIKLLAERGCAADFLWEASGVCYVKPEKEKIKKHIDELGKELKIIEIAKLETQLKKLEESLQTFFARTFVKRVIAANCERFSWNCENYADAVWKYCEEYRFFDMMAEWLEVMKKGCSVEKAIQLTTAFSYEPASIKAYRLKENSTEELELGYTAIEYAEMFVCDDGKEGNDDMAVQTADYHETIDSANSICDHFNTPIYPMVLVARSSAQEGFNLQYYGDKMMHWQFTPTIEAFLQREGRLDRPNSLTMRQKVWKWANILAKNPMISCYDSARAFREEKSYSSAWKLVADENVQPYICNHAEENKAAKKDGLVPTWILELPDEMDEKEKEKYQIKQIIAVHEYNESLNNFAQGLYAALNYGEGVKA